MKVLKYILYAILSLTVLFVLMGLFARHNYHIERTIEIETPRDTVFRQVRFFKNAPNWSPWLYLDPNVQTSIEGTDGEAGAVYKWSGNKAIGTGSQTLKSVNPDRIDLDIVFSDFTASPAYFFLSEKDKKTTVTWGMDIHVPFPWNALAMLTDMNNSFIGKDFANGLANLKKYCEALAPKKYRGYEVQVVERPVTYYAALRQVVDFPAMAKYFADNFPKVIQESEKAGAKMMGAPCGLYWTFDTLAMKTDMAAAIPLDKQVKASDSLQIISLGGKALIIDYYGGYDNMSEAHNAIADYMAAKKLQDIPPAIEEYVTDPGLEPDTAKWLTRVVYFVRAKVDSTGIEHK